jgi:hypothetical protein
MRPSRVPLLPFFMYNPPSDIVTTDTHSTANKGPVNDAYDLEMPKDFVNEVRIPTVRPFGRPAGPVWRTLRPDVMENKR